MGSSFFDESCGQVPVRKTDEVSPAIFRPVAKFKKEKNEFRFDWIQKDLGEEPSLGGIGRSLFTMLFGYFIALSPGFTLMFFGVDLERDSLAGLMYIGLFGAPFVFIGLLNLLMCCTEAISNMIARKTD